MPTRKLGLAIIGLLLFGMLPLTSQASPPFGPSQQADDPEVAQGRLDVIFALDVSTSMAHPVTRANHQQRDRAMRYVYENGEQFETIPTDPDKVRFEAIDFLGEWLQHFVTTQADRGYQLNVNASVVTFSDTSATLAGWVNLHNSELDLSIPSTPLEERNSDFIELFGEIIELENTRLEIQDDVLQKTVVIILTDSLPCDPAASIVGARDASCGNTPQMLTHLTATNLDPDGALSAAEKYLFVIPPNDGTPERTDAVRTIYGTFDDRWNDTVDQLTYLNNVHEFAPEVFRVLLNEAARVLGVPGSTDADIFNTFGLVEVHDQSFNMRPYQTEVEMLMLSSSTARPSFNRDGDSVTGFSIEQSSTAGYYNRLLFETPRPGNWIISSDADIFSAWVSFSPARARIQFSNQGATQYTPLEIRYELIDNNDMPLQVEDAYAPVFDIVLSGPGGEYTFDTFEAEGNAYVAYYLPIEDGLYTLEGTVIPDASWEDEAIDFTFLKPIETASITVDEVTWSPVLGTELQQAAIDSGGLQMPRRNTLPMYVQVLQDGNAIEVPEGVLATVLLSPVPNTDVVDACPDERELALQPGRDNRLELSPNLHFPVPGECVIILRIELTSPLLPVNQGDEMTVTVFDETILHMFIDPTVRLDVEMIGPDGAVIDPGGTPQDVTFEMEDRKSWPPIFNEDGSLVTWNSQILTIEFVFRDELGRPVNPQFEGYEIVEVSVEDSDATSTEEPVVQVDEAAQANAPVPFEVRIAQGDQDNLAIAREIVVRKRPQVGYYTLTVRDLEPGDYVLQVSLITNSPTLHTDFEYSPDLVGNIVEGQYPTFSATLRVTANPAIGYQKLAVAIVAAVMLFYSVFRILKMIWNTIGSLRGGRLSIYRIGRNADAGSAEEIWYGDVPTRINNFKYRKRDLPLFDPPVDFLEVKTRRRRNIAQRGAVYVILRVDKERREYLIEPGAWPQDQFYTDPAGNHYFLVKDWVGVVADEGS